jgi:hypothetical protein
VEDEKSDIIILWVLWQLKLKLLKINLIYSILENGELEI